MGIRYEFNENAKYKILLLSHISADNLGDQMIELCSNALVRTVMNNLKIDNFDLVSVDASIVNNRYLSVQEENQIELAESLIQNADLIIFGGSPVFNYAYEGFSERTVKTLDIIKRYNKPVIFSGIGIEKYDATNSKCMRLKDAMSYTNIKMITTRDNIDALKLLTQDTSIKINKVADPAVFTAMAMKRFFNYKKKNKIGVFVIRGNAFKDNGIPVNKDAAIKLWKSVIKEIEDRGYDYELLTSGSLYDEAFLDELTMSYGVKGNRCVTCLNSPEELIRKMSEYAGIISCRLHPSIIAYSMRIPAVGLIWNDKVTLFYDNIGYKERAIPASEFEVKSIVDKLEVAIRDGVKRNPEFMMSTYVNLFNGIVDGLNLKTDLTPYSYEDLIDMLPLYEESNYTDKMTTKLARVYRAMNGYLKFKDDARKLANEKQELISRLIKLQQQLDGDEEYNNEIRKQTFPIFYNIQRKEASQNPFTQISNQDWVVFERKASVELRTSVAFRNDGSSVFLPVMAEPKKEYRFKGYRLRASLNGCNFVLLQNGKWVESSTYKIDNDEQFAIFQPGDRIPVVKLNYISALVIVMLWEEIS